MSEIKTCEHYVLATLAAREQELEKCHEALTNLSNELSYYKSMYLKLVDILKRNDDSGKPDEYYRSGYIWKEFDREDYDFIMGVLEDDRTEELNTNDTRAVEE